jgi:hypothetical protein
MQNIELHWGTPIIRNNKVFDNHEEILEFAVSHSGETNDDQAFYNPTHGLSNHIEVKNLSDYVLDIATTTVQYLNQDYWNNELKAEIVDMWSWSSKDYYNPCHSHPNCSWSFIYMIDPGEPQNDGYDGCTLLYSPMPWGNYADPGLAFMERTYMQWHRLNKGDIILFPSYVRHSAKYNGTVPRTLIAGNLKFS